MLYRETHNYVPFLNDGMKDIFKTKFPIADAASQGCAQIVESLMPLAVTRPFVEELITKEATDKVSITLYNVPHSYAVHLVVIFIWQFGGFSSNRQIKIIANTVVLSQVLINF